MTELELARAYGLESWDPDYADDTDSEPVAPNDEYDQWVDEQITDRYPPMR